MTTNLYKVNVGDLPLASDIDQYADAFNGVNDVGQITFIPQTTALSTTGITATAVAGTALGIGTYLYRFTWVVGYKKTNGTYVYGNETDSSGSVSVTTTSGNQAVNLVGLPTVFPTGVIALRIYRTLVGGADLSQKLVATITTLAATYSDTITDASLGAAIPPTNSTGISITVGKDLTVGGNFKVTGGGGRVVIDTVDGSNNVWFGTGRTSEPGDLGFGWQTDTNGNVVQISLGAGNAKVVTPHSTLDDGTGGITAAGTVTTASGTGAMWSRLGGNDLWFNRANQNAYIHNNAAGGSLAFNTNGDSINVLTLGADHSVKTPHTTFDNGSGVILMQYGGDTTNFVLGRFNNNSDYQMRYNDDGASNQLDGTKPSWAMVLGGSGDIFNVWRRAPGGSNGYISYLKADNTGRVSAGNGGESLDLMAGASADHTYMGFYARSASQTVRSGYFGFGSAGITALTVKNEITNGDLQLFTTGTGKVVVGAPAVLNGESWHDVAFQNGFVNYGNNYTSVQYMKDANGNVHLRGLAKSTGSVGSNTTIFTLPAGYVPPGQTIFHAIGTSGGGATITTGRLDIHTDGTVAAQWAMSANDYVSFEGIIISL